MFGPPGLAYVCVSYGVQRCFNTVSAPEAVPELVVVRAVEPLTGLELMQRRRGLSDYGPSEDGTAPGGSRIRLVRTLCGGPGRMCQAFGLDGEMDGYDLTVGVRVWIASPIRVIGPPHSGEFVDTSRIGVSQANDRLWRYYRRDDPFISRR
jgi:DNA-3-methyladenine glycosylase